MAAVRISRFEVNFYNKPKCDRCGASLIGKKRILSWFTDETICVDNCHEHEQIVKEELRKKGDDDHEGCGYLPKIEARIYEFKKVSSRSSRDCGRSIKVGSTKQKGS